MLYWLLYQCVVYCCTCPVGPYLSAAGSGGTDTHTSDGAIFLFRFVRVFLLWQVATQQ